MRLMGLLLGLLACCGAEAGASAFIVASDQAFMRKAARAALAEFATLKK